VGLLSGRGAQWPWRPTQPPACKTLFAARFSQGQGAGLLAFRYIEVGPVCVNV
jgi:hypothetical protein